MQPFEMMLLALRPLQLNCNCNGTTALPNQQPPSAPSANATAANATAANATAAGNETMAANATSANATAANATSANETAANATTFQASAQAQGQALTIEKICGATCSANLCNDTCLRVFIAENATEATNANDIQILNFALSLELLDSRFFVEGLNNFTAEDFEEAGFPNTTLDFITRIRDNELAHASALQSAIGSLGGTPVEQCNYSFPINNVTQFVEIAQRLENVGVSAYDGTLAFLTSPQLQTTGATIASVEARHAAYLNLLRGMIPFPDALDTPLPIATVLGITDAFVVSCPDQASQQTLEILRSLGTATPANATQS
jgi:rubrerythrin